MGGTGTAADTVVAPRAGPTHGTGPAPDGGVEHHGPLRFALAGLTTRGRSFVAAGLAAAVCAYLLGQPDLLRVGALLCLLPLLCVVVLHRTRPRVTVDRHLSPTRMPAGSEARVRLRLENRGRGVPTGVLMLQDRVPLALGPRPRFVVGRVPSGGTREVSYRVRSELRGRYPLGPLQLRLADPFGLVELERSFTAEDLMTVLPPVEPLPSVPLGGHGGLRTDGGRPAPTATGDDDVIPREYRHGDDLRRVHWRSTAHRGALMVRREEQARTERCTVLLDTRGHAWSDSAWAAGFERAVSGAASVVAHVTARGYSVRLVTDTGAVLPGPGAARSTPASVGELVNDGLAGVERSSGAGFADAVEVLAGRDAGLLVAFVGRVDAERAVELRQLRRRASAALAFLPAVDPGATAQAGGSDAAGAARGTHAAGGDHRTAAVSEPGGTATAGGPRPGAGASGALGEGWTAVEWEPGVPLATVWERATTLVTRPDGTRS